MSSSSSQSEAYDCKIFQNVVEPTSNINAFLAEFAPASTPPPKCLVYKLIHTDPHLLSRASTVWEAFALNGNGEATGKRVVIKEAWQYTSMPSEITFYHDLQEAAAASAESGTKPSLSGIVRLEGCNDLGAREVETFARGTPRPGYRTMRCEGSRVHERSFVRMVFGTIGTPLYRFKSTYEVACALRDAIEGIEIHYYSWGSSIETSVWAT